MRRFEEIAISFFFLVIGASWAYFLVHLPLGIQLVLGIESAVGIALIVTGRLAPIGSFLLGAGSLISFFFVRLIAPGGPCQEADRCGVGTDLVAYLGVVLVGVGTALIGLRAGKWAGTR